MSVLVVQDLKKSLGANEILSGVGLRIDYGEKVGCVGRNGEGKTTFLRLIEGELAPDGGTVQLAKRARVGYVLQRPDFGPGVTVRGYVETGLEEVHRVAAELERTGEAMAEVEGEELDRLVRRHGELTARMDFLGGWETERRVEAVLSGIGLATELWERGPATLSGGEKSRAAMARELVSVPDLLLLDEPTNHLDVAGIEWLEDYLASIGSAVLMVSHDRRMLDGVVDTIVEVERGAVVRYPGNYSRYVELKGERFASALRTWEQQRDSIRKEEAFIRKHMGSQRTAEAKGRRKRLQRVDRLVRPYNDVRRPTIRPPEVERGGEQVLEVSGLSVGRGTTVLLEGVDLRLGRGERVGVVGPNGSGKTTLLKTLAGELPPLAGEAVRGYRATCGYYDQETGDLHEDSTPFLEIRREHTQLDDQEIRDHLARFLFRGAEVDHVVGTLSGGERARLSLALLVLRGPSWLALDEPTNHLDLASRTAVEEFLGAFPGAFVCVSHDRELLDRLCDRIVEVDRGGVRSFRGNYSDYRRQVLSEAEEAATAARTKAARAARAAKELEKKEKPAKAPAKAAGKPSGKSSRKARPRNPWRLEKLEKAIISLEERRDEILGALSQEDVFKDPNASRELQLELAEIERDLQDKNTEWENWT